MHAGGITHLRRDRRTWPSSTTCASGCHGATDLSPVCMAAALHFDLAIPNFGIQEYMRHTAETDRCSRTPIASATACSIPATNPGWAWTSTRTLAARFPYRPAMLPVARLQDGTVHDW